MTTNTNITVTGVDFGSSAVKIAAVLKGGVEVITNQANFRQTPNVVGMSLKQRLIGQAGQLKIKSNHSNTVVAPSRYLGFDRACPYLSEELRFCPARAQTLEAQDQRLQFNLQYGTQRSPFTSEQLVASYITEIEKITSQTNNLQNKNLVIAVPTYATQHERRAFLDAVEISKKKVKNQYSTQLVNEEIAVSMDYGHPKRLEFTEDIQTARKVLFVDFGHSKTSVFLTAFNKQHFRVLTSQFDRQLGCKSMDIELLNFYAQKFDSAHPNLQLNLLQSKKAVLKLLQNIQKQRRILSGIMEHDLSIECLLEDEDLHYSMKRQEYEQICQPVVDRFKKLLQSFYEELKLKGIKIDAIEMVGGGTRIPAIINAITEVFQEEPSRTLNSNQCIARGAALISAMNSSVFRVQPYSYFTTSPYNVEIKINSQNYSKNLIDKHELLLKEKSLQLEVDKKVEKFTFLVEYQQGNIEAGLQSRIFECEVQLKPNTQQKPQETTEMKEESEEHRKISLSILIDQNGLIRLDTITSPNCDTKIIKFNDFSKYSPAQLSQMQQKQKQMTIRDINIKRFYEKKNEYESVIYKSKHSIQDIINSNQEYLSQSAITEMKTFIEKEQNWLNSGLENNQNLKMEDFVQRQNTIKQKVDQFINSINVLKQSHELLNNELQKLADLLNEVISKRTQDMYPEDVNKVGGWINQIFQKQKNTPKFNPPVISPEQVKQVHQDLLNKIHQFDQQMERQRIMNARRTKPGQQRYQPSGTVFRPSHQSAYNPNYGGRSYESRDDDYFKPRRSNRSGYNNPNPFGSFFGGSGYF